MQLILERVPPVFLLRECLDRVHEIIFKESLGKIKALQLFDGLELLFSLHPSSIKSFCLESDARKLFFNLLLPLRLFSHSTFVVTLLEFLDGVHLVLLLHLKSGLFNSFTEEDIQNGLNFFIVVEQVIVFDLSDFIDTSLLWHIFRSGRLGQESIRLHFHICNVWLSLTLLS